MELEVLCLKALRVSRFWWTCLTFDPLVSRMPKSKEVLSSTSGSDSDSEVETKAKRKKSTTPEKPAKKAKSGESSKPSSSAKSSGNGSDNMFQVRSVVCCFDQNTLTPKVPKAVPHF
uniref:Uncharacterized protein n=1 Tax=Nothobranchius furzeri TaxID=105023 RepID=A0A8C6LJQ5_NOTFU